MHFTADTVIVITGSSRGLGLEFVKHFLEYTDSKVVATARSLSKADALRTLVTQYSKRLHTVALDTSEESSIEASVKEISALHSGIDLLINNAGIEEGVDPIWETTGATYSNVLKVNVVGVFLTTKAFLPLLRKKQSRTIVQLSSIFASTSFNRKGTENNPAATKLIAYNSSKAALNMQTSVFANALNEEDFCIIAINPGWNETEMGGPIAKKLGMGHAPLKPQESAAKMVNVMKKLTPKNSGEFLDLEKGDKIDY
ncbi:hypothetical protein WJX79_005430 [Trebouxia sp. C0005]|nr:MAG: hypothetical protein FRX49_09324 [Trebouxia sp. A1-2]